VLRLISLLAAWLAALAGPGVVQEQTRLAAPGGATAVRCAARPGPLVQVLYVRPAGRLDRYRSYLPFLGGWAVDADRALFEHHGRHLSFVQGDGCRLDVRRVAVPAGAAASLGATVQALRARGYDRPGRTYLAFVDTDVLACSASRPGYVRIDAGCWFSTVAGGVAAAELLKSYTVSGSARSTSRRP
jgi:hypothetical protein